MLNMDEEIKAEFVEKPETIGQILQKTREERKITIEQVAHYTCFRPEFLRALEADDYSPFKCEIYVKGTIRGYGNFLGLDGLALVNRYKEEQKHSPVNFNSKNGSVNDSHMNISLSHEQGVGTQTNFKRESRHIPFRQLITGCCVLFIMILMYYSLPQVFGLSDSDKSADKPAKQEVVVEKKNNSFTSKVVNVFETINNLVTDGPSDERPATTVQTSKPVTQTTTSNKSKPVTISKDKPIKGNDVVSGRYDKVVVEMTATDQCWIDVFSDGKAVYSGMMTKGRYKIFEAKKRVTVKYGNIGAVQVIVNGKPVNMRNESGVATRNYPK